MYVFLIQGERGVLFTLGVLSILFLLLVLFLPTQMISDRLTFPILLSYIFLPASWEYIATYIWLCFISPLFLIIAVFGFCFSLYCSCCSSLFSKRKYPCSKTLALIFLISLFYATALYTTNPLGSLTKSRFFCIFLVACLSFVIIWWVGQYLDKSLCPSRCLYSQLLVSGQQCLCNRSFLSELVTPSPSDSILSKQAFTTPPRTCPPTRSFSGPQAWALCNANTRWKALGDSLG